jgi:hypothetical protein
MFPAKVTLPGLTFTSAITSGLRDSCSLSQMMLEHRTNANQVGPRSFQL